MRPQLWTMNVRNFGERKRSRQERTHKVWHTSIWHHITRQMSRHLNRNFGVQHVHLWKSIWNPPRSKWIWMNSTGYLFSLWHLKFYMLRIKQFYFPNDGNILLVQLMDVVFKYRHLCSERALWGLLFLILRISRIFFILFGLFCTHSLVCFLPCTLSWYWWFGVMNLQHIWIYDDLDYNCFLLSILGLTLLPLQMKILSLWILIFWLIDWIHYDDVTMSGMAS